MDRFLAAAQHGDLQALLNALVSDMIVGARSGDKGDATHAPARTTRTIVSLGYLPDVRFAPFYIAHRKGYYEATGFNVTFQYGLESEPFRSLVAGLHTFVFASGDEVLMARANHLPVVTVATMFQRCPVSLIVPAGSPIRALADLKGRTIGAPAAFGAIYTGLLLLLDQAQLSRSDIQVQTIGFTQVAALVEHRVDAVMGYSNHEPVLLRRKGVAVRTFDVAASQPLVSNGIVVAEDTVRCQPQKVSTFVQATLRGLRTAIDHPLEAAEISKEYLPGETDAGHALAVLQATFPFWQGDRLLGHNDSDAWQIMAHILSSSSLGTMVPSLQDSVHAYTNLHTG